MRMQTLICYYGSRITGLYPFSKSTVSKEDHSIFFNACEEAGVECLFKCTGEDLTEVRSTLDTYIAQGCNVIVDFLSSLEISQAISEDCEHNGVIHICIDADPSEYSYFYGLSNGEAGAALGEYLVDYVADEMGGKCDLVILMDSPSHGEDVGYRTEIPKKMLIDAYDFITEETVEYLSLTVYDMESVRRKTADFLTTHADRENIIMISFASSFNDAIDYIERHIIACNRAIDAGAKLASYFVWTLMDDFEWNTGYANCFGLVYVDRVTKERTIKKSGMWYKAIIEKNGVY